MNLTQGKWGFNLLAMAVAALCLCGCPRRPDQVVLYCAQDQEFADRSLQEFTLRSGCHVIPKFDTEADKSVSLYYELLSEKDRPRCDVFWNNEILNTIRLERLGLLEPYECPASKPYPETAHAPDHSWHAFAMRARILIVNTDQVAKKDRPRSLLDLTDPRWKGRIVMAKPKFGTSATQAACLFAVLGADRAKAFYHGLKENGVQIAPGNKQVAEWVGQGHTPTGQRVAVGITDTDDALEELAALNPVEVIYPDRDRAKDDPLGTLYIPNTLALIKGSPNPSGGKQLIDFLLSPVTEGHLAAAGGHQIPMNPEVKVLLPMGLETPATAKAMKVDFYKAADMWDEALTFLEAEFEP